MSECRWDCPQDLNALAPLGRDDWSVVDSHTSRGFARANFRDTYGQPCSVQESSNVEPSLWVGVDCCRMHLSPDQARGLAERLLEFAAQNDAETPRCPHGHAGCCGHHDLEDMPIHSGECVR